MDKNERRRRGRWSGRQHGGQGGPVQLTDGQRRHKRPCPPFGRSQGCPLLARGCPQCRTGPPFLPHFQCRTLAISSSSIPLSCTRINRPRTADSGYPHTFTLLQDPFNGPQASRSHRYPARDSWPPTTLCHVFVAAPACGATSPSDTHARGTEATTD